MNDGRRSYELCTPITPRQLEGEVFAIRVELFGKLMDTSVIRA